MVLLLAVDANLKMSRYYLSSSPSPRLSVRAKLLKRVFLDSDMMLATFEFFLSLATNFWKYVFALVCLVGILLVVPADDAVALKHSADMHLLDIELGCAPVGYVDPDSREVVLFGVEMFAKLGDVYSLIPQLIKPGRRFLDLLSITLATDTVGFRIRMDDK